MPKTTKGKVLPTIHSPMDPMIMRTPPKKKYAAGETKSDEACLFIWAEKVRCTSISSPSSSSTSPAHEVARQGGQTEEEADQSTRYSSASRYPHRGTMKDVEAYIGVGLPNVFRKSPLTRFSGER